MEVHSASRARAEGADVVENLFGVPGSVFLSNFVKKKLIDARVGPLDLRAEDGFEAQVRSQQDLRVGQQAAGPGQLPQVPGGLSQQADGIL